ncbi:MAG: purine-nucleoside phosphorylase [Williamsia sp.]|nr:purine-nucleoside phosphorylase [Williamsia sp.]
MQTDQLDKAVEYLRQRGMDAPDAGVILGTGLHRFLDYVTDQEIIPYAEIPHFPVSTVEFHKGQLVWGTVEGKKVLVMQGRFHYYEGYTMQQVVFPVRVMRVLGIRQLLITNAAGGINPEFKKGDLVSVNDHINLQTANPLTGKNWDGLGPRFPDMSRPYSERLNQLLFEQAACLNVELKSGVYAAVNGPNLETRAEYRYLKIIGADMVGMSTVPEVIAAAHMELPCAAISVITDECDPDHLEPVNIQEIIATAAGADQKLSKLLQHTIRSL